MIYRIAKKIYDFCDLGSNLIIKSFLKKVYAAYDGIKALFYRIIFRLSPDFFVKYLTRMRIHGGGNFMKVASDFIPLYLSDSEQTDPIAMRAIKKDMADCYFRYGINPEEYLIHNFRAKNTEERERYISKKLKDESIGRQLKNKREKAFVELKDKYKFYELTGPFFKRDVCQVRKKNDKEAFSAFVHKHQRFIAKPVSGRFGKGTCILSLEEDFQGDENALFESLVKDNSWILEELINQDARMAVWNESSVNTVRIPSFRTKNGIKIMRPFVRMGRKGSVVDNAGHGGIFFSIDAKTGTICTKGRDESGNVYDANPDNGREFANWQVPEWDGLLKLSEEIHNSLPSYHKYVGFDFALSKDYGWVLVEGNWGDFICQQSTLGFGVKQEFFNLLNG